MPKIKQKGRYKVIRFIRFFIMGWRDYPHYEAFRKALSEKCPEDYAAWCGSDIERGVKPTYDSRFEFAWRTACGCTANS